MVGLGRLFFCPLFLLWPATKVSRNLSFRNIFLSFFSINLSFLKVYLVKSSSKSKFLGDGIQKSEFLGDFSLSYAPCLSFFRTWVFRKVDKKKAWVHTYCHNLKKNLSDVQSKLFFKMFITKLNCVSTWHILSAKL